MGGRGVQSGHRETSEKATASNSNKSFWGHGWQGQWWPEVEGPASAHLCFHQGPNTLTELKLLPVILQVHWTIPSLYPGCTLPRMPFPTLTAWRTPHSTSKAELKCHLPSMLFILPSLTLVWLNRFPATRAPTNGFLLPTSTKKGQTYCANRPTWLQRSLYFQLNLSYPIWWPWATCSSWELKYRLLS